MVGGRGRGLGSRSSRWMRSRCWPGTGGGWAVRLASRTRQVYLAQVTPYVDWLAGGEHGGAALREPAVRDWAVRDYKRHLSRTRKLKPASVNQALAAIDNFCRQLGAGPAGGGGGRSCRGSPRARSTPTSSDGSCARWNALRRRGTGRSPPCSSTPACGCPSWPPSTSITWRCQRGAAGSRCVPARATSARKCGWTSACRSILDTWTKARDGQLAGLGDDGGRPGVVAVADGEPVQPGPRDRPGDPRLGRRRRPGGAGPRAAPHLGDQSGALGRGRGARRRDRRACATGTPPAGTACPPTPTATPP